MELYIIRHGETEWTVSRQHTGTTDIPLTESGENQASLLSPILAEISFTAAFSSPLKRAIQTAKLAGLDPELDPDLVEWNYGDYEGLKSSEIGPNWSLFRDGAPNGESLAQISERADRVLKKMRTLKGPIAIFSHGHFSRALAARWLGLEVSKGGLFYLSVASISILGLEHNRPVLKLWNSTYHLNLL